MLSKQCAGPFLQCNQISRFLRKEVRRLNLPLIEIKIEFMLRTLSLALSAKLGHSFTFHLPNQ